MTDLYFAILNFALSAIIGFVGIMTLRKVSTPNEVIFASLPLLFALHQFIQAFVWLGMNHIIQERALQMAQTAYVFFAQGLLQFLIPLAIWLIEPKGIRKNMIAFFVFIGGFLMAYTLWGLSVIPTKVSIIHNIIYYQNPTTDHYWVAIIYIITTCGSLILSKNIWIQLFGWLNLSGLSFIYWYNHYGVTSIWCLYAAVISVVLYLYFVKKRIKFLQILKKNENQWSNILEIELTKLTNR